MTTQSIFCYMRPHALLQRNGCDFKDHADGSFSLSKGEMRLDIRCGDWSAVWLNNLIASKIKGISPFPIGFNQDNALSKVGVLGKSCAGLATSHPGADGYELDSMACAVFASVAVERGRQGSKLNELKTAYVMDCIEPIPAHQLLETSDEGGSTINLNKDVGKPFYMAIDLKQFKTVTDESQAPPAVWARFIEGERFYWNMAKKVLYLSNCASSKYGLPPNHVMLGYDMALEMKDWKVSITAPANPPDVGNLPPVSAGEEANWESVFSQFMGNPNSATFNLLRTREIRRSFKSFKGHDEYNYGTTRKYKLTTVVLDKFSGPEMAATFQEFAQAVREAAGDNLKVQFCLLMKLEGQVKQLVGGEGAGKFYLNAV